MKFLARINRGLIVTLVLLIAVAIYLTVQSTSHSAEEPKIKDVCEKYIKTAIGYKMLPMEYRKEKPDIGKVELDRYISGMSKELKVFYTDNEQTYKSVIQWSKSDLENQAKGIDVVYDYEKQIEKYQDLVFDNDVVTVTILCNSSFDGPDITTYTKQRAKVSAQTTDTITLQKKEGSWKVIYADLQQPTKYTNSRNVVVTRTVG